MRKLGPRTVKSLVQGPTAIDAKGGIWTPTQLPVPFILLPFVLAFNHSVSQICVSLMADDVQCLLRCLLATSLCELSVQAFCLFKIFLSFFALKIF